MEFDSRYHRVGLYAESLLRPHCAICGDTYEGHWYWSVSMAERGRQAELHDYQEADPQLWYWLREVERAMPGTWRHAMANL